MANPMFIAQKLNHDTLIALIGPKYPKYRLFSTSCYDKIFHHFHVKFHNKSNENNFIFQNPRIKPLDAPQIVNFEF